MDRIELIDEVRNTVRKYEHDGVHTFVELGYLLHRLYAECKSAKKFKLICKEELSFSWRKGYYLMAAADVITLKLLNREQAINIGFWKIAIIRHKLGLGHDAFWIALIQKETCTTVEWVLKEHNAGRLKVK